MTRLLVLDDELDICHMMGDIADEFGFDVDLTTTPGEFLRSNSLHSPDLIVLDLAFPGGDGIEMLRALEASHYKGSLILFSGSDTRVLSTARRIGIALGIDVVGAVEKPFLAQSFRDLFAKTAARFPSYTAADFTAALANAEFVVHYMPIVDMRTRHVSVVEALIRWARPDRELVQPDQFLPSVARLGMMPAVTSAVIGTALADASAWKRDGSDLRVAINVPASVALGPAFFEEITQARGRFEPFPPNLMIELTETEAMGDPVRMMEVLSRLRLHGIELAIDDFGTGYSSLVELRRLPFSRMKIDKSFVLSCVREADAGAITRAVIDLGHALGISVVAEGVETKEIWDQLVEWRCDSAQGYLVARAMPIAELKGWSENWSRGGGTVAP